jgi:hypothetical protein
MKATKVQHKMVQHKMKTGSSSSLALVTNAFPT